MLRHFCLCLKDDLKQVPFEPDAVCGFSSRISRMSDHIGSSFPRGVLSAAGPDAATERVNAGPIAAITGSYFWIVVAPAIASKEQLGKHAKGKAVPERSP
jgi:hypothetical protein